MAMYKVQITEVRVFDVFVNADYDFNAPSVAKQKYEQGYYVSDIDDVVDTSYRLVEEDEQ